MLRQIARRFRKPVRHRYLFVLSPPYCGSTLLCQIIASSKHVSINNPTGTCEGQTLPGVKEIMFVDRSWDAGYQFDWDQVKEIWHEHWDLRKPILLEKSPPNILRAAEIEHIFDPAWFIVLVRNPYAQCESLMRRNGNTPEQAAGFVIKCLRLQKKNRESLKNVLFVAYEDLTHACGQTFSGDLSQFLNDLDDVKTAGCFNVHNSLNQSLEICNLNQANLNRLSQSDIVTINKSFQHEDDLISYFGYEMLSD